MNNILVRLTDPLVLGWFADHPEISAPRFIGESIKKKYGVNQKPLKGRRKHRGGSALFVSLTDAEIISFLKAKKQNEGYIIKYVVEDALRDAITEAMANGTK